jgi:hypothetical protein
MKHIFIFGRSFEWSWMWEAFGLEKEQSAKLMAFAYCSTCFFYVPAAYVIVQ